MATRLFSCLSLFRTLVKKNIQMIPQSQYGFPCCQMDNWRKVELLGCYNMPFLPFPLWEDWSTGSTWTRQQAQHAEGRCTLSSYSGHMELFTWMIYNFTCYIQVDATTSVSQLRWQRFREAPELAQSPIWSPDVAYISNLKTLFHIHVYQSRLEIFLSKYTKQNKI